MYTETMPDLQLVMAVTIINRGFGEKVAEMFSEKGARLNMLSFGKGTASSQILNYLGLAQTEKDVLFSTMPAGLAKSLLQNLGNDNDFFRKNRGIAFTVAVNGVMGDKNVNPDGVKGVVMENLNKNLIIAVAERGYTVEVMEAAKSAGATGGTVIHARGTGIKEAEKFFGMTIQPEKELVLILVQNKDRENIMREIISKAGPDTKAKAVVFSLPVNGVAGLPAFKDEY